MTSKIQIKEKRKNKEKQARNRKYETLIKNQFKKIELYLKEKKSGESELKNLASETQRVLDKAKKKGVIHKNKANHHKSREQKKINKFQEGVRK